MEARLDRATAVLPAYRILDNDGKVIDSAEDPMVSVHNCSVPCMLGYFSGATKNACQTMHGLVSSPDYVVSMGFC